MKFPIFSVVSLILTATVINAQTMDSTINKLLTVKLIDQKQVKEFEEYLARQDERTNGIYIHALFQSEYKKLTGYVYSPLHNIHFDAGDEKISSSVRNKINRELTDYLSKLKDCGLVKDQQSNEQLTKIRNNEYVDILQFLPALANQVGYEDWLSNDKIIKYAEKLLANNVLTEKSFESLKNDAHAGKIKSHHQFIEYCRTATFFDLAKYSNDPAVYVEQIHREVSSLLPQLSFTDFTQKIEVDSAVSFKDYTAYKLVVSLKIGDKIYKHKSFISPNDIGKDGNYLGKIDGQEFYEIFNKALADDQSPLRLHQVKPGFLPGEPATHRYFGVIALAKPQLDMFRYSDSYIQVSYEKFRNSMTSKTVDAAIKAYQEIGLFKHLEPVQIEKAKEKVNEQENRNLNEVLVCFPGIIYFFDTELSNLDDPYAALLRKYSEISHNEFDPVNISDDFDIQNKKKVMVKFKLRGKEYQHSLKIDGDWVDPEIFSIIGSVVEEHKLQGRFYDLYTGGQEAGVIYLSPQQYEYIRTNKLLVFSDQWSDEEEE